MITPSSSVSFAGRIGWLATSTTDDAAPFVGRVAELARLRALFAAGSSVVQLVGPSGIGKTRLARTFARQRRGDFQRAWVCDVRELVEPDDVLVAIVRAVLGDARAAVPDPRKSAPRVLERRGKALVVLDDVDASARSLAEPLAWLLAAAPDLRLLITGRTLVPTVEGAPFLLGPLRFEEGVASEAYELFLTRLRALRPDHRPSSREQGAIAWLCERLGGVPLAIEMAAARAAIEGTEAVGRALPVSRPLENPTPEASAAAAIASAFSLLPRAEQACLAQCSVFAGSFGLDAVRAVVQLEAGVDAADVVVSLARRNLLSTTQLAPLRFAMGACVRSHAAEVLEASLATWEVDERHAHFFGRLAEAIVRVDPERGAAWLTDALRDRDNLDAAMAFAARSNEPALVLRLAWALDAVSRGAGITGSELAWVDQALALDDGTIPAVLVAHAHAIRARALLSLGWLSEVRVAGERALPFAVESGDQRLEGALQHAIGQACFQLGEMNEALTRFRRALELTRARGDRPATSAVLQQLGSVYQSLGDGAEARNHLEAALALAVAAGDGPAEARAAMSLGSYYLEQGELEAADGLYERARDLTRALRMHRAHRIVTAYLGVLAFDAGRLNEAESLLRRAAVASGEVGDLRVEGIFEGVRGAVLAALDLRDEARRSFARARALLGGNLFFSAVIDVHRGHLDLADARVETDAVRARSLRLAARMRIEDAHSAGEARTGAAEGDHRSLVERSDDARIAVRILERALARPVLEAVPGSRR
ncbi:MAG: tetratricopeptide repeat protein [Myxococcales bacterium]|nr:tetratricopeptide repeat protein [Myxococcales bacterium]